MTSNDDISVTTTLNLIKTRFLSQLPIIFLIFGFIGFIGNVFTFLQSNLRRNTFCIYSLCGSFIDIINLFINLLPNYIYNTDNILSLITNSSSCKWKLFGLVFIPQLSMNLLVLSLIDRYICTCDLISSLRKLHQLKVVPYLIGITVLISGVMSLYSPLLYDVMPSYGCLPTNPLLNGILYIVLHGCLSPFIMLIFICLTYRNIQRSRQRVVVITNGNAHHPRQQFIRMIVTQVIVTSFFVLQWIIVYIYYISTQINNKTAKQRAILAFLLNSSNNLYYLNNVKSFYLSTLACNLYRETLMKRLFKLMHKSFEQQGNTTRVQVVPSTVR